MAEKSSSKEQGGELAPIPPKPPRQYKHTLADYVDGLEKRALENIVANMTYHELHKLYGVDAEHSFLFHGPPGSGKTYGVHAIRNELEKTGKSVGYYEYSIGEYGTAYINMGARNLQDFLDGIIEMVKEGVDDVAIIHFDECEAIMGHRGSSQGHKEDDKLLNTLMTHLQRIGDNHLPVYCFFSTNFIERLDRASIRAGRIHRKVEFHLPDQATIAKAYELEREKVNRKAGWEVIRNINPIELARGSDGLSLADVHEIVSGSVRDALKRTIRRELVGKADHVRQNDLLEYIRLYRGNSTVKNRRIGFELPQ